LPADDPEDTPWAVHSLVFLGTGPGTPVAGRACSSCLLQSGASLVLVDAGEPCSTRLVELGFSSADLDAVLITHAHSDHTGGLPMLLQSAWLAPRTRALPLYLPGELVKPLIAWLEAVYLPGSLIGFPLEFHEWEPSRQAEAAPGVRVRVFPTTHLRGLRERIGGPSAGRFEVFGLDISCGSRRIVFSSDLGAPSDLAPVLATPCDLLVCELSHFHPEDLFELLRGRAIGRLLLNHLAPELNGNESALLDAARRALPQIGEIRAVRDGDRVEF
jgi:ribonuclease BN (tRNA processing enzyme)